MAERSGQRPQGGGVLQSMLGGFRSAVGVETRKKKSTVLDYLIWAVLLAAAVAIVYYRYRR